jgi:hypothetical protein
VGVGSVALLLPGPVPYPEASDVAGFPRCFQSTSFNLFGFNGSTSGHVHWDGRVSRSAGCPLRIGYVVLGLGLSERLLHCAWQRARRPLLESARVGHERAHPRSATPDCRPAPCTEQSARRRRTFARCVAHGVLRNWMRTDSLARRSAGRSKKGEKLPRLGHPRQDEHVT